MTPPPSPEAQLIASCITLFFFLLPAFLGIFVFRQKPVKVRHKKSGITKTARLGWSWTYLYFGFLVPALRGEVLIAVLHLVITFCTFGLFQILWSFFYNKQQITRLLTHGWVLADTPEVEAFVRKKLNIQSS